jgi:hypothetical protein
VVNGEVSAKSGSFNLPSSVVDCLVYVTSWLTLEPGDVVMTGAPGTAVAEVPGARVDIDLGASDGFPTPSPDALSLPARFLRSFSHFLHVSPDPSLTWCERDRDFAAESERAFPALYWFRLTAHN